MIRRKLTIKSVLTLALVSIIITFSVIHSFADSVDSTKLKKNLIDKGIDVTEVSTKGNELKVKFKSKGVDKITPDDILSMQSIRNEARSAENKGLIQDLNLTIQAADGKIIYDSTKRNIMDIPKMSETSSIPKNTLDIKQTEEKLVSALSSRNIEVSKLKVSNSDTNGKSASLIVQFNGTDVQTVNSLVPQIQTIIEGLNNSIEMGIYRYDLTIQDQNKQPLIVLAADLIYREFTWWQTPDLDEKSWSASDTKKANK